MARISVDGSKPQKDVVIIAGPPVSAATDSGISPIVTLTLVPVSDETRVPYAFTGYTSDVAVPSTTSESSSASVPYKPSSFTPSVSSTPPGTVDTVSTVGSSLPASLETSLPLNSTFASLSSTTPTLDSTLAKSVITRTPTKSMTSVSPQQPSTTTIEQGHIHHLETTTLVAIVVPCALFFIIALVVFVYWRIQKHRVAAQIDHITKNAIWLNLPPDHPDHNGTNGETVSPSAVVLPRTMYDPNNNHTVVHSFPDRNAISSVSPTSPLNANQPYFNRTVNPFLSPSSQISFPEHQGTQPSHTDDASTTSANYSTSSVNTVIHHRADPDPFTDRAATSISEYSSSPEEDVVCHPHHLSTITERSWPLKSTPCDDAEVETEVQDVDECVEQEVRAVKRADIPKTESDIDLAKKLIRGLKKEAFEAQKAAAAAERRALDLKEAL